MGVIALDDNTQKATRKAVDLGHSSTLQSCWYLNESYLYEEFAYAITILIQGNSKVSDTTYLNAF